MDRDCHSQTDMTDADKRKGKHELITLQKRSSDLSLTMRYLKQATLISVGQANVYFELHTASKQVSFRPSAAQHKTLNACNIQQQATVCVAGIYRQRSLKSTETHETRHGGHICALMAATQYGQLPPTRTSAVFSTYDVSGRRVTAAKNCRHLPYSTATQVRNTAPFAKTTRRTPPAFYKQHNNLTNQFLG